MFLPIIEAYLFLAVATLSRRGKKYVKDEFGWVKYSLNSNMRLQHIFITVF